MKLFKKMPPFKKGFAVAIHLHPVLCEPVIWPATYTEDGREIKPERLKWQHVVLGYSYEKTKTYAPMVSEHGLISAIFKEIRNGKKTK